MSGVDDMSAVSLALMVGQVDAFGV
jgi:hypothetical protein